MAISKTTLPDDLDADIWARTGSRTNPNIATPGKYDTGWVKEVGQADYQNYVDNRQDTALASMVETGIPEYNKTVTYDKNARCRSKVDGFVYVAILDGIVNKSDPSGAVGEWTRADKYFSSNIQTYAGSSMDNVNFNAGTQVASRDLTNVPGEDVAPLLDAGSGITITATGGKTKISSSGTGEAGSVTATPNTLMARDSGASSDINILRAQSVTIAKTGNTLLERVAVSDTFGEIEMIPTALLQGPKSYISYYSIPNSGATATGIPFPTNAPNILVSQGITVLNEVYTHQSSAAQVNLIFEAQVPMFIEGTNGYMCIFLAVNGATEADIVSIAGGGGGSLSFRPAETLSLRYSMTTTSATTSFHLLAVGLARDAFLADSGGGFSGSQFGSMTITEYIL